jgi:hypothetical protein
MRSAQGYIVVGVIVGFSIIVASLIIVWNSPFNQCVRAKETQGFSYEDAVGVCSYFGK